jgi:hypothetical protein
MTRKLKYPSVMRGAYLELTDEGHDIWMHENNPDGWDNATWAAFVERIAIDARFSERVKAAKTNGHPRPNPLADGWVPSKKFDPIAGLTRSMTR